MDHIEYMRQLGRASRASLTASQRKEQASKAARKRWGNANGSHTPSKPYANGSHTIKEKEDLCRLCHKDGMAHIRYRQGHSFQN